MLSKTKVTGVSPFRVLSLIFEFFFFPMFTSCKEKVCPAEKVSVYELKKKRKRDKSKIFSLNLPSVSSK